MKMNKLISIISALLLVIHVSAQQADKSKGILDKASTTLNAYKTISSDFVYTGTNTQTNETITESGKLLIKNEKYHLTLKGSEVYFDGKDVYNYITKSNEVNITYPEPTKTEKGEFFISNPRDIFKFQSKNFKSKLVKETTIKGLVCYEVDLYPIDLKTKYSRIKLHINKANYHILDIKIFEKEGMQQNIEFSNFTPNTEIPDAEFVFDTKKHAGVIVNDMRF
jgi:outer membrane lipoprotein carrier protein